MKRISRARIKPGYGIVQRDVMCWHPEELSVYGKAIYGLLVAYAGEKEYCFPSQPTLMQDLGLSKPTVIKGTRELEALDLVGVLRTKGEVNRYYPKYIADDPEPLEIPSIPGSARSSSRKKASWLNYEPADYPDHIHQAFLDLNNWMDDYTPIVRKLQTQITIDNFMKLVKSFDIDKIKQTLLNMQNHKPLVKKYTSVYLTLNNWIKRDPGQSDPPAQKLSTKW